MNLITSADHCCTAQNVTPFVFASRHRSVSIYHLKFCFCSSLCRFYLSSTVDSQVSIHEWSTQTSPEVLSTAGSRFSNSQALSLRSRLDRQTAFGELLYTPIYGENAWIYQAWCLHPTQVGYYDLQWQVYSAKSCENVRYHDIAWGASLNNSIHFADPENYQLVQ